MSLNEILWGAFGFLLTVMILSYLIGDNFFFRLAGHLFVGLTAGYLAVVVINYIIWPTLVIPFAAGTWLERLWLVIPAALILFLVLSQSPRFSNLGIVPIAYLIGVTAALAIGGAVFGTLLPQAQTLIDAFEPGIWYAVPEETWLRIAEAVTMLLGVVTTLSFFHFGRKRKVLDEKGKTKRPFLLEMLSKFGQVFIGITLGAIFAGVFSSALLALIDRIYVIGDFIIRIFGGG